MRVITATLLLAPAICLGEPQVISVVPLAEEPTVDGALEDWPGTWLRVPVKSAVENDEKNRAGEIEVELQAGIANGRIYVAARWPDGDETVNYRPWVKRGGKYRRDRNRDDMFALRFHKSGDFDRSMISDKTYEVDVWVWSSGRSNLAGHAEDLTHRITTEMTENAAEYEGPGGKTVYIVKTKDAGTEVYSYGKPAKSAKDKEVPSVVVGDGPTESMADVRAKGAWKDGRWSLEMTRALDTGHEDDVNLLAARKVLGQIAVFNNSNAEHKSVSEPLLFVLGDE